MSAYIAPVILAIIFISVVLLGWLRRGDKTKPRDDFYDDPNVG